MAVDANVQAASCSLQLSSPRSESLESESNGIMVQSVALHEIQGALEIISV